MIINSTRTLLRVGRELPKAAARRILQKQVERIQDRLNQGIDVHGRAFAPYKYPQYARQWRPLLRAARLFEPSTIEVSSTSDGAMGSISIFGRAARIARWQNKLRQFYGYSDDDRRAIVGDAMDEAMRIGKKR